MTTIQQDPQQVLQKYRGSQFFGIRLQNSKIFDVTEWSDRIDSKSIMTMSYIKDMYQEVYKNHPMLKGILNENGEKALFVPIDLHKNLYYPRESTQNVHEIGDKEYTHPTRLTLQSFFPFDNMVFLMSTQVLWLFTHKGYWFLQVFEGKAEKNPWVVAWKEMETQPGVRSVSPLDITMLGGTALDHIYPMGRIEVFMTLIMVFLTHELAALLQNPKIEQHQKVMKIKKGIGSKRTVTLSYSLVKINPTIEPTMDVEFSTQRASTHHRSPMQHDVKGHLRTYRNQDGSVRKVVEIKSYTRGNPELGIKTTSYKVVGARA